jgi:hypothetical protein
MRRGLGSLVLAGTLAARAHGQQVGIDRTKIGGWESTPTNQEPKDTLRNPIGGITRPSVDGNPANGPTPDPPVVQPMTPNTTLPTPDDKQPKNVVPPVPDPVSPNVVKVRPGVRPVDWDVMKDISTITYDDLPKSIQDNVPKKEFEKEQQKLKSKSHTERTVDPAGVNVGDMVAKGQQNQITHETAPANCDATIFYRSFLRPYLNLSKDVQSQLQRFSFTAESSVAFADPSGTPSNLSRTIKGQWSGMQKLGRSVGKFEGLTVAGWATGTYLTSNIVITCAHVGKLLDTTRSAIRWGDSEAYRCVRWSPLDVRATDLAFVFLDRTPTNVPSGESAIASTETELLKGMQLAVIGYPTEYGGDPVVAQERFPDLGALFLSPGVCRDDNNPLMVGTHDCASGDGSSGSAVVVLQTGEIVGFQTGSAKSGNVNIFSRFSKERMGWTNGIPTTLTQAAKAAGGS